MLKERRYGREEREKRRREIEGDRVGENERVKNL